MYRELAEVRCNQLHSNDVKIMTKASILINSQPAAAVEIRRGMVVICAEGGEAGHIAGVVVSQDDLQPLCLILGHLPQAVGYQSVPIGWIERIEGEAIILNESFATIQALADWHDP